MSSSNIIATIALIVAIATWLDGRRRERHRDRELRHQVLEDRKATLSIRLSMTPDFRDPTQKAAWEICADITNVGLVNTYPTSPVWLRLMTSGTRSMATSMNERLSWRSPLEPGQNSRVCVDFWATKELIELNQIPPDSPVQAAVTTEAGDIFLSEPTVFPFSMRIADDQNSVG